MKQFEIVKIAGRKTVRFWLLDNSKNKPIGKFFTLEEAQKALSQK